MRNLGAGRRQLAVLVVFVLGVVATVADQPIMPPTVQLGSTGATISLDPDHPAVLTRVVADFSPESTLGGTPIIVLAPIQLTVDGRPDPSLATVVHVIATTASPADPGGSPGPGQATVPPLWQAELSTASGAQLQAACGSGPCERAFWLVAELADTKAGPVDVAWSASASVTYREVKDYPSGGTATFTVDAPVKLAGPAPALAASTPAEILRLGPTAPAAGRVVDVTVGADAIPADGSSPVAIELLVNGAPTTGYPANGFVQTLDSPDGTSPPKGGGPAAAFTGCAPSAACTRRFLVTFQSTVDVTLSWALSVRRLDVGGALAHPADLAAEVSRRFDIDASRQPSTAHLEAVAALAGANVATAQHATLTIRTTSTDPVAGLLPVPLVMDFTMRADVGSPSPRPSDGWRLNAGLRVDNSNVGGLYGSGSSSTEIIARDIPGPRWQTACGVGVVCHSIEVTAGLSWNSQATSALAPETAHWTLDARVYSYTDVPMAITATPVTP
ncbi:MAG: hypothetical protein U0838_09375 [Chloroflexota bacterium]